MTTPRTGTAARPDDTVTTGDGRIDPPSARSASVGGSGSTTTDPRPARIGDDTVLASDAEREHVANRLREAAAEGRLTLDEADERQSAAYAARTRDELGPLLSGLPRPLPPRRPRRGPLTPRARRALGIHAGLTVAILLFLTMAAVFGPAPLFMPLGPAFWLGLILFVHSRRAEREPAPQDRIPEFLS